MAMGLLFLREETALNQLNYLNVPIPYSIAPISYLLLQTAYEVPEQLLKTVELV